MAGILMQTCSYSDTECQAALQSVNELIFAALMYLPWLPVICLCGVVQPIYSFDESVSIFMHAPVCPLVYLQLSGVCVSYGCLCFLLIN